jgi:hypothetical protein
MLLVLATTIELLLGLPLLLLLNFRQSNQIFLGNENRKMIAAPSTTHSRIGFRAVDDSTRIAYLSGLKPKKPHLNTHCLIDCMSLRTSTRYHVLKKRRHVDENSSVSQRKQVTHVGLDPLSSTSIKSYYYSAS